MLLHVGGKIIIFFNYLQNNVCTPKNDVPHSVIDNENSTDLRSQQDENGNHIPQSVLDSNDNSIDLKNEHDEKTTTNVNSESYRKPAQEKAKANIVSLTQRAAVLAQANNSTMSNEIQKELDKTRQEIEKERKRLKRKQQIAEAQKKLRINNKN
ncbi:uncharacterized protein LOC133838158 [Drosophila sulfurigaster albostrigata]|uniref:uncharacterized protein LOC133838158 n=1 Tax=Drosophila sulfurigaster albostrigata TaxID=89887 RepID=UPI002D21BA6A|nr:uncharacterized protein LOC133838158 [Drosophila sulfurigaster albostrigata]